MLMEDTLQEEQRLSPVNIDKAEYIISLASKKNGAFKPMMQLLREVEEQLLLRQKKNRLFYQVVKVVDERYKRQVQGNNQQIESILAEMQHIQQDMDHLTSCRANLKQELEGHEDQLNEIRDYAEQRRNKKSKREKQYHQLYNIPIVATQFKKKYVRARDKNSDAEERVSEVRATVDSCQRAMGELSKSLGDCQKRREELTLQQGELSTQKQKIEDLLFNLHEGCKFWMGFDQYQSDTAAKATNTFIETIQKHAKSHNTFHKIMDPNNDFVKILKMALFEYGQAESYAQSRWDGLQVEYDCAKCRTSHVGWPTPDKVRTADLLCDTCYKEARTSMIWEKKMKMGMDRSQQLLSLPGGSTLSFSSTATAASSSSSTSMSSKPGFKKVMQIFKGGKRRSSSNNSYDSPEQQRNSQLLRA
ncbi:uncharacterized protein EV154DRAFT_514506 [Mucor mucedo]|uniref:uncharacterized protein n=1 Tax=Mucor mucedo TaxID=29922 RepID=UPI00222010EB|nr:uncharacterized protein EV154DRAFT_514506 [Mucor mucedo]KAI7889521.1 hypothetical protein EV154DRAFT_514506 [Mucor mucedo]